MNTWFCNLCKKYLNLNVDKINERFIKQHDLEIVSVKSKKEKKFILMQRGMQVGTPFIILI